jgi:uroporphyrinogen decarboxylase
MRRPDFTNLLNVLQRKKPARPTLFEFFMNQDYYERLAGESVARISSTDKLRDQKITIEAFMNAGYDYVTLLGPIPKYRFIYKESNSLKTKSLNQGGSITDEESYYNYRWPEPDDYDYSNIHKLSDYLPDGMKIIISNTESVFGGVYRLMGFDNLCFMLYENEHFVKLMFDAVGSRVLRFTQICAQFKEVGAIIVSDDWGYKTQTMISPFHMRKYVFPWHKKIVQAIHESGKPAILHSCGNLCEVYDDVINDIGYDGKHSFEDAICPVEDIYDKYHERIAILGGIDMNYLISKRPEEITDRAIKLLEKTSFEGGYALGSGNSIPTSVPFENYMAMIEAISRV